MARRRKKSVRKKQENERGLSRSAGKRMPVTYLGDLNEAGQRLPPGRNAWPVREALVLRAQRQLGNRVMKRRLAAGRGGEAAAGLIQRENGTEVEEEAPVTRPGGRGPGELTGARENFYEVNGATLDAVSPQLNHFDGFAAETSADLGMDGEVTPERVDGVLRVEVDWVVTNVVVGLPRWVDYDQACPAAQQEWNRFMRQTRIHEQSAHVDESTEFVERLGAEDKVITGADVEELQANLVAKRDELGGRLQAIHDGCDHGASIDAILHPDNGRCAEDSNEGETESSLPSDYLF